MTIPLTDAARQLVVKWYTFALARARDYHACYPWLDRDDLNQEATLGLMEAVRTRHRARGAFATWAKMQILARLWRWRNKVRYGCHCTISSGAKRVPDLVPVRFFACGTNRDKGEHDPADAAERQTDEATAEVVEELLRKVRPGQRHVLLAIDGEGRSYADVAKERGCTKGAVRRARSLAMKKLQKFAPLVRQLTTKGGTGR